MTSVFCKIGIRVTVAILRRVVPKLKERARESRSPYDDLVIEGAEALLQEFEEGKIAELLCG